MTLYLGIDTSAYTTSIALVNQELEIILDARIPLQIGQGERGLRQSQALFFHLKNLPCLFEKLPPDCSDKLTAMAASAWPRRVKDSYMPVFLAGYNQARVISSLNRIPLYTVSHQEGHIMAALLGHQDLSKAERFLAVHFSGGTSEILQVQWDPANIVNITTGLSGTDLHAGQLVDRIGVALGLPFPSGPELEKLAGQAAGIGDVPALSSSVTPQGFSFSGLEAQALRMIHAGADPPRVALALFRAIAKTLEKAILYEANRTGVRQVLLAGGVMANQLIKERLCQRLEHPAENIKLHFAQPRLCSDNAVGVAQLAARLHMNT